MHRLLVRLIFTTVTVLASVFASVTSASASTAPDATSIGFDVSFPQCNEALPISPGFGIVGVNNGTPFSVNDCLARELAWAKSAANPTPALYTNTQDPGPTGAPNWPTNQTSPDACSGTNSVGCSYDYGWNAAHAAFSIAVSAEIRNGSSSPATAVSSSRWWLDVETGNRWQSIDDVRNPATEAYDLAEIDGEISALQQLGVGNVGIYSTTSQWVAITGGANGSLSSVPVWIPGFANLADAQEGCATPSFTGARVAMIQYPSQGYDGDYVCGLLSTPASAAVSVSQSLGYSYQVITSNNSGPVTYVQGSGAPALVVSTSGLVTTSGSLAPGTYVATGTTSDAAGDLGTFSFSLQVGVLRQTSPTSLRVKVSASASFTSQLNVSGSSGPVTYVQGSGAPALVVSTSGLVTTSGSLAPGTYVATGNATDTTGDRGTFTITLEVGSLSQRAPLAASISSADSSTFSTQLNVGANFGPVSFVQVSGAPALVVSTSGLVTTSGALAPGTYVATGNATDTTGDRGRFIFTLQVTAPVVIPIVTSLIGNVIAAKTVNVIIKGSGFYAQPTITSHPGTTARVVRDTGNELVVRVSAPARSRDGAFVFTIRFSHGQSCTIGYVQR